ncbi:MAG: hypothetical protein BWY73_00766 [candidate division TA06 bacterium ADurb.Bin417]|uniref:DUF304 domain-containing protein n=1 Tax=candidate division TA06 bacterium ADurb.Bin417 TaxID=1852828 RepID=A0A1V5MHE2_UNCT6|nr:MAG: hypothetical protein BWY73_00766 [candidate division TA06 bacterium ADurb.Bin417]
MNDTTPQPRTVECRPARDPAVRLGILTALLLGFGLYCIHDAFLTDKYPYVPAGQDINAFGAWAFNFFGSFAFTAGGVVVLGFLGRYLRRRLVADAEGIGYAGSEKVAWSDIARLDASELKTKGILRLHYGPDKVLTLDSWKLQNFRDLVVVVESRTPPAARAEG